MKLEVEIPDSWPKGKNWQSATLMKCDHCNYATPDSGLFLVHVYNKHLIDEIKSENQPETLTTAP